MSDAALADFVGAKVALVCGDKILVYLRDDKPGLPWAAKWDLPGGGREGEESPETCALRELEEEFGLVLTAARLIWGQRFPSMISPERLAWFFAGHITPEDIAAIRFGTEGQTWEMMPIPAYLAHPAGIPDMQHRASLAMANLALIPQGA
ncbi:MAG: NUDIX hydrolase [Microgenomates group bacterium]